MPHEKITLVSFMRDEAENAERMLRSVEGLYDYHCIGFDLAMTDNTEEIVRRTLQGKPGIFYYFRWRNHFAWARNLVLDLARDRFPDAKYALSMDGDDLLDPRSRPIITSWLEDPNPQYKALSAYIYLDADPHGIPALMYPRVHLLENNPDLRWEQASHNVLKCPSEQQLLIQNLIVHHNQRKNKRLMREAQRVSMNLPNLSAAFEEDSSDARPLFYKANTELDSGEYAGAEQTYLQYLEYSTWPDERFQAWCHLAAIRFNAGDLKTARQHLWRAMQEPQQWTRAEGFMHLGDCAMQEGNLVEALHWYGIAGNMQPPVCSMFLQGPVYTYLPHWRMAMICDRLGMAPQAYQHAKRAAEWRPSQDILAGLQALEHTLTGIQGMEPITGQGIEAIDADMPLATKIYPLPDAELERLLAEIPTGTQEAA